MSKSILNWTIALGFLWTTNVQAQALSYMSPVNSNDQPKIHLLDVAYDVPDTLWKTLKYSFTRESIPAWAAIVGSTAVLYHYDDDLYLGAQHTARGWHISNDDHTKTIVHGFGYDLLRLPSDTGSALYFLGDGWTHTIIALSFFGTGYLTENNRAYNTGLEIVHGMITSTIFDQALKRATGRESPNHATAPRGRWRPFPSINAYGKNTPKYDAFPSGHIMTATMTFSVIQNNYPEYSAYIWPIEGLWLTALGFEMVNNGVHWASDYPLGIGIGYVVAKMAYRWGHPEIVQAKTSAPGTQISYFPSVGPFGPEMNAQISF